MWAQVWSSSSTLNSLKSHLQHHQPYEYIVHQRRSTMTTKFYNVSHQMNSRLILIIWILYFHLLLSGAIWQSCCNVSTSNESIVQLNCLNIINFRSVNTHTYTHKLTHLVDYCYFYWTSLVIVTFLYAACLRLLWVEKKVRKRINWLDENWHCPLYGTLRWSKYFLMKVLHSLVYMCLLFFELLKDAAPLSRPPMTVFFSTWL